MRSFNRWQFLALAAFSFAVATPVVSAAQAANQANQHFETRAQLEEQARTAEAEGRDLDARLIRHRLSLGDFPDGDRILVPVRGPGGFTATLRVPPGRQLELPPLPPLSLTGILRSELQPRLTAHLTHCLREPVVIVRPLLRVGILGNVLRPGYYYTSADLPLTDVLMAAGGPTPEADVTKVSVRRGGEIIMDARKTRGALTAGRSLDMLHMQAGDEIEVGKRRQFNWGVIVPSVSALLGLAIALSQ